MGVTIHSTNCRVAEKGYLYKIYGMTNVIRVLDRNSTQNFWHPFCADSLDLRESHKHFPKNFQRISNIISFTH